MKRTQELWKSVAVFSSASLRKSTGIWKMVLFAFPSRSNDGHKHSMVETAVIQSSSAENPRCDDAETSQLSGAVVGGSGSSGPALSHCLSCMRLPLSIVEGWRGSSGGSPSAQLVPMSRLMIT